MELDFFVRSRIKKNSFLIPRYAIVEYDEKCDEPEVAELFDHAFSGLVDRFGLGDDELALTCEFSDGIKIYSHSNFNVMFPVMESVEVLDSLSGYDVKFPFIWCGEAEEGLHVGPIIKSVEDLSFYTSIFRNYRSNKDVREMVGIEKIPTSLAFWIRHKATVDTAIEKLLALNGNNRKVILLETLETKHLGVPDDIPTRNSDGFYAEMSWSKGFLYGAENIECDEAGIYHACSLVPDVESESLAACAGKGSSPEEAMIKDVGESVERYNAWSPDVLYHGHAGIADRIIKIDEIHVKKYASCDEDIESFLSVTNISDADDVRYVPAELVVIGPFNYRASCSSDTTGLAAHVTREDCRESALYECIERHHFYPNITNLNTPIQCLDLYEITKNFKKNSEVEFVIFTYFTNLYTFVIHCFAFNTRKKIWTRGTGSAANVYVASEKAVQEAVNAAS